MTESPPDERPTRPFAAVLAEYNNGRTAAELSEDLQAIVAAVKATGKKGTLTVQIVLTESKAAGALDMVVTKKTVMPQPKQFSTIFYVDDADNLVRNDPRQTELDLSPVRVAGTPGKAANQ